MSKLRQTDLAIGESVWEVPEAVPYRGRRPRGRKEEEERGNDLRVIFKLIFFRKTFKGRILVVI